MRKDASGQFGVPPVRNASLDLTRNFFDYLAPMGIADLALTTGGGCCNLLDEGEIRKAIFEGDLVVFTDERAFLIGQNARRAAEHPKSQFFQPEMTR